MFRERDQKEEDDRLIALYWFYRKMTRAIIALAMMINLVFVMFVINEGIAWIWLVFTLNLYVAGIAYWYLMKTFPKKKKTKEIEPVV